MCRCRQASVVRRAGDPALPADIAEAKRLIPGATLEWLSEQLPGVDEAQAAEISRKAADLLDPTHS
jgi:hypothetical protein